MTIRKWKLALAALLGFSAACSTVKRAPREEASRPEADTTVVREQPEQPRIVLMYGVRPPLSDSVRNRRMERQRPDSLPPVAERPFEEEEPMGK